MILSAGGYVSNAASAAISSGLNGVYVFGAAGVVTNRGTITGTGANSDGVHLVAGGTVINVGITARITGGQGAIEAAGSPATVTNQGSVSAANGDGVHLKAGGMVANSGTAATISGGGFNGVYVAGLTTRRSVAAAFTSGPTPALARC